MTNIEARREELKHRILARQKELESKLEDAKADVIKITANEREKIGTELKELGMEIKMGWENLSEAALDKLNEWLNRTDSYTTKH